MPPRWGGGEEYVMTFDLIDPLWRLVLTLFPAAGQPAGYTSTAGAVVACPWWGRGLLGAAQ